MNQHEEIARLFEQREVINAKLKSLGYAQTPITILRDAYGLEMTRFASDNHVRWVGVRAHGSESAMYTVDVDREKRVTEIFADKTLVVTIQHASSRRLAERAGINCLLLVVRESVRKSRSFKKRQSRDFVTPQEAADFVLGTPPFSSSVE